MSILFLLTVVDILDRGVEIDHEIEVLLDETLFELALVLLLQDLLNFELHLEIGLRSRLDLLLILLEVGNLVVLHPVDIFLPFRQCDVLSYLLEKGDPGRLGEDLFLLVVARQVFQLLFYFFIINIDTKFAVFNIPPRVGQPLDMNQGLKVFTTISVYVFVFGFQPLEWDSVTELTELISVVDGEISLGVEICFDVFELHWTHPACKPEGRRIITYRRLPCIILELSHL